MNALDKVIGYFSPERAYRRARFRSAAEMFAYDGAKSGRRTDGWMAAGGDASLIAYDKLGRDAALSIPSPDHYLPLLCVLGTRQSSDKVSFPVEGVDGGSMSMLAVYLG